MKSEKKPVKPLNLNKLRKDLQLIMDEIDRTHGVLPDYYSPIMWMRLQETADRVANAIQAVRMKLSGLTSSEIADKLGLGVQQVAAYVAWNTMFDPHWVRPKEVIAWSARPKCDAEAGQRCQYHSAPANKIHSERREAFRNSAAGKMYLKNRAEELEERYGVKAVAAS